MASPGKFLPPDISASGLFHYHKGRVAKIPSGMSYQAKYQGVAKNFSESFVKFDKAAKGIRTARHMHEAANYISRNGDISLEDENGLVMTKASLDATIDTWCFDQNVPEDDIALTHTKKGVKRAVDARRLIVSCPKGTDPEAVRKAAREFGETFLKANGFQYVFGVHFKDDNHPKEPEHPHVHFLVKTVSINGKRLNIRKADLQLMREEFAIIARKYGIELNATTRIDRDKSDKTKNIDQIYQEQKIQSENSHKAREKSEEEKKRAQEIRERIRKRKSKQDYKNNKKFYFYNRNKQDQLNK